MSKARLVITAVVLEHRRPSEVADAYGVSRSWLYELLARYREEGDTAFEPRSRRPKSSPTAIEDATVELIIQVRKELAGQGLDAGPDTICWHLAQRHQVQVSPATVARYLTKQGLVLPEPKKRPKASYIRFQADLPNQCWQSDFTHYRLTRGDGTPGAEVEIISWLDDCSRYVLSCTAHPRVTARIVNYTFLDSVAGYGIPASTLTDNGMVYTVRFATGQGGRTKLENTLRRLNVMQKNSRPNHPTTCGKIERLQQTLKKWLAAQPHQPTSIAELQALLDRFVDYYNQHRPHRSLPQRATPATVYESLPKAAPSTARDGDTHARVRHDRIDESGVVTLRHNGRLHHIGIGRTHARTHILMLVHDLEIRVVNAATGELLRELILDPTRDYQPTARPPGPSRK